MVKKASAAKTKSPKTKKGPGRILERDAMKIVVVKEENPRREGTAAHAHFEAARKAKTVGEYKERFSKDEKSARNATIYLRDNVKAGYIELRP